MVVVGGGGGEEREKVARMRVTTKPGLWTGLQHIAQNWCLLASG